DRRRRRGSCVAEPGPVTASAAAAPTSGPSPRIKSPVAIGRGEECHPRLDDARASRTHAELSYTGDRFTVRDLSSRNGTFLDGERIGTLAAMEDGSVLTIGNTVMLLCADARALRGQNIELLGSVIVRPRLRTSRQAI